MRYALIISIICSFLLTAQDLRINLEACTFFYPHCDLDYNADSMEITLLVDDETGKVKANLLYSSKIDKYMPADSSDVISEAKNYSNFEKRMLLSAVADQLDRYHYGGENTGFSTQQVLDIMYEQLATGRGDNAQKIGTCSKIHDIVRELGEQIGYFKHGGLIAKTNTDHVFTIGQLYDGTYTLINYDLSLAPDENLHRLFDTYQKYTSILPGTGFKIKDDDQWFSYKSVDDQRVWKLLGLKDFDELMNELQFYTGQNITESQTNLNLSLGDGFLAAELEDEWYIRAGYASGETFDDIGALVGGYRKHWQGEDYNVYLNCGLNFNYLHKTYDKNHLRTIDQIFAFVFLQTGFSQRFSFETLDLIPFFGINLAGSTRFYKKSKYHDSDYNYQDTKVEFSSFPVSSGVQTGCRFEIKDFLLTPVLKIEHLLLAYKKGMRLTLQDGFSGGIGGGTVIPFTESLEIFPSFMMRNQEQAFQFLLRYNVEDLMIQASGEYIKGISAFVSEESYSAKLKVEYRFNEDIQFNLVSKNRWEKWADSYDHLGDLSIGMSI